MRIPSTTSLCHIQRGRNESSRRASRRFTASNGRNGNKIQCKLGTVFLILMVAGLVGLVMMAIPALGGRGHAGALHSHAGTLHSHGAALHVHAGHAHASSNSGTGAQQSRASNQAIVVVDPAPDKKRPFIPSPRAIFSFLALYGAFGNALLRAGHLSTLFSAAMALLPALIVERLLIRPLFSLVFRFQAPPSSSLEALLFADARAVVPFHNGRGIVSVNRDGRLVQLTAHLRQDQASFPVKVGEHLRVEAVNGEVESVTVSVIYDESSQ